MSTNPQPVKIGIIGCGNISGIYFKAGTTFSILDIVACADLDLARARAKAEEAPEAEKKAGEEAEADKARDRARADKETPAAMEPTRLAALSARRTWRASGWTTSPPARTRRT